ncbi:MAG: RDD family protein [Acidobacteriota bacterium]
MIDEEDGMVDNPAPAAEAGAAADSEPASPALEPPELRQAPVDKRLLAAIIDGVIGLLVAFIPVIGGLLAATYWLVRDGLEAEFMDHRSIGKVILKLRPVTLDGSPTDITDSIRRNWMFAPAGLIPFLAYTIVGLVFAFPLAFLVLIVAIIEVYLVLTDPQGRRLGDKIADTIVIETDS